MTKEKPITRSDLIEVLGDHTEAVLLPAIEKLIDGSKTELRGEIRKSEQRMMDYTDKRVGESEGKMNLRFKNVENRLDGVGSRLDRVEIKLDKTNDKVDTLTDVLREKEVITPREAMRVKKVGVVG